MAINNYTLATKPYTRGFGDKTTTVVEIRLQEGNRYSTNQRELVELFPLVENGKSYSPGSMFAIEDPEHTELNGEGKRILIQTNQQFIYQGESLKQLEGSPSQNGILAVWKWGAPKANSELETQHVQ